MSRLEVCHTTTYRYDRPVRFGQHRAMLRPRDSHDLKLRSAVLTVSPVAEISWMHDVFGNSVTLLGGDLRAWALKLLGKREMPTLALLTRLTKAIKQRLRYVARENEGTQTPEETLAKGGGTCRDYALLMIEAVRSLGFAARFVTGYLYDPALDGGPTGTQGAGATHAWVQVYLPGAGWVEFDPTNGIVGGRNLIRVGVARDPKQAIPLAGTFIGDRDAYVGMEVEVRVTRLDLAAAA